MRSTYDDKLALVRTGLGVIALAEQRLRDELGKFLKPGDDVWVKIGNDVFHARMVYFTADNFLRVNLVNGNAATIVHLNQLVERPAS